MRQPRINWLRKRRLQLVDLFRDCAQSCDVFGFVAAACSSRINARRSRRACAKSTRAFSIRGYCLLTQRRPASETSWRFASSQSDSASPGSANLRRRSEMKYARKRICSSDGSAGTPASGGTEPFVFCAVAIFLSRIAGFFRFVAARRGRNALPGFTSAVDPAVSADV